MPYPMLPHEEALLLAARARAFAEDEKGAGRSVSTAEAVRHVAKHGYPPTDAAASFAEGGGGANMFNAVEVLVRGLLKANSGLSRSAAIARVGRAAHDLAWDGKAPASAGTPDEASARGLLWLSASHLAARERLGFDHALRRSVQAVWSAVSPGAAIASFAEPIGSAGAPSATERVAKQVQQLMPSLSYREALQFASRDPNT